MQRINLGKHPHLPVEPKLTGTLRTGTSVASKRFDQAKKALLIMKLFIVMILTGSLQLSAKGIAQTITLSAKNESLETVFLQIEKQTDYSFVYEQGIFKSAKKVNLQVTGQTIEKVLSLIFSDQPLSYKVDSKLIIVREKKMQSNLQLNQETKNPLIDIKGRILNEKNIPVVGASITEKDTKNTTTSKENGEFTMLNVAEDATLLVTNIGYQPLEIKLDGKSEIIVQLKIQVNELAGVTVLYNGYQQVSPERATGSYSQVSNELLNRSVSANILDRIENLTTGVSFKNANDGILIRGRSSIFSNVSPLIIVDNFPYDGNINNINPNDVENVTILKDAAAASIWGARAGNGVIVITTKRGKTNKPQVQLNSNFTVQQKPDLFNMPLISSADYIELEKLLFSKGYYDGNINTTINPPPLTPVVEILAKKRNGQISPTDADLLIDAMKNNDARNDLKKYFYQKSLVQQYAINVSGNSGLVNYYMSAGFDQNNSNLIGSSSNRISLRTLNTFKVSSKLQIEGGINFVQSNRKGGNNSGIDINSGAGKGLYPYADLVDANGNPLVLVKDFRSIYTDTAGAGKLLDWKYRPLGEIDFSEGRNRIRDYMLTAGIKYQVNRFLNAEIKYQYENSLSINNVLNTENSYSTRDLINKFYQPAATIKYPVPIGGILDITNNEIVSHQGRAQLNYTQTWGDKHDISAIAGWEIKDLSTKGNSYRIYGYKQEGSIVNPNMDFVTQYAQYNSPFSKVPIANPQSVSSLLDRFISYYANASYTYDERYTISASGRNDAANLFGVKTNQKGVPLWSIGFSWGISNEKFYSSGMIPTLRLRATYGYNGNFSRATSALTTATYTTNAFGLVYANIQNPPNEKLRWERVRILNLGLDFQTKNQRISGTIEYFNKESKDLIAAAPADPTLGILISGNSAYVANVASMSGSGFEFDINTKNIDGQVKWQTTFLFSYALNKITDYLVPASTNTSLYLAGNIITPLIGKPVYNLFSYQWHGLDPATGDPLGYAGKDPSKDYVSITTKTKLDSMVYHGAAQAPYFGAVRNTFSWKSLSLSVNISYKMGYYFRTSSVSYSSLVSTWTGHSDYARRWKNPGDEKISTVPSFVYPVNPSRDNFYLNSEVLVEKGDHIRLEDVALSYNLSKSQLKKMPFKDLSLYLYSNLGILLWKANDRDIDPYYPNGNIIGRSASLGLKITL